MSKSKKKNLILVVGDQSAVLSHLREVLVPEYEVEEASDGVKGFKMAKELLPELVISDFAVLRMDGTRLCKALKNDNETWLIPLLLISNQGSEACIVKGLESGADDCIGWPFNVDILKARIKNLVDHRKHLMDKIWLEAILHISQLNIKSEDSKFIEQLHGIIEENLSNPLFTVGDLGKKLYMSRASMYRKIHYLSGLSPQLYIRSYRLKRAAQLLENHYGNVTEVCFKVGFTSTAYFAKCFKEEFHQTPKTFVSRFASGLSPVSTLTMHGNV